MLVTLGSCWTLVRTKSACSKTGRCLSKAEILGVGVFSPLSIFVLPERLFLPGLGKWPLTVLLVFP